MRDMVHQLARRKRLMVDLSLRDVIDVTLALKNYLLEKWHRKHHASASSTNSLLYFFVYDFPQCHTPSVYVHIWIRIKNTHELPRCFCMCWWRQQKGYFIFLTSQSRKWLSVAEEYFFLCHYIEASATYGAVAYNSRSLARQVWLLECDLFDSFRQGVDWGDLDVTRFYYVAIKSYPDSVRPSTCYKKASAVFCPRCWNFGSK